MVSDCHPSSSPSPITIWDCSVPDLLFSQNPLCYSGHKAGMWSSFIYLYHWTTVLHLYIGSDHSKDRFRSKLYLYCRSNKYSSLCVFLLLHFNNLHEVSLKITISFVLFYSTLHPCGIQAKDTAVANGLQTRKQTYFSLLIIL